MSASREKKKRQEERANYVPPKKKFNYVKFWVSLVVIVVVLYAAGAVLNLLGVPQNVFTYMSAGGERLSVADYNFSYNYKLPQMVNQIANYYLQNNYMNYYNQETGNFDREKLTADATAAAPAQTINYLHQQLLLFGQANKRGIKLDVAHQGIIDDNIAQMKAQVTTDTTTFGQFLNQNYGNGVSENTVRAFYTREWLSTLFTDDYKQVKNFTEAELTKAYEANKKNYDVVTYMVYTITGANTKYPDKATEEQKTTANDAAKTEAQNKGDALKAKATSDDGFVNAAKGFMTADEKKNFKPGDLTRTDVTYAAVSEVTGVADFLFADTAKAGDMKIFVNQDTNVTDGAKFDATVVRFLSRKQQTGTSSVTARILTLDPGNGSQATEEQAAAAKQTADKVVADFKAGAKTEDAFAALVSANATDIVEKHLGGLQKGQTYDPTSTVPLTKWLSDAARKPGDVTIIPIQYTYTPVVTARILTFNATDDTTKTPAVEEVNAAKAKADKVLADFKAGAKTEEAFTQLVKDNATVAAEKDNGGKKTGLTHDASSEDAATKWWSDAARKAGDTAVLPVMGGTDGKAIIGYQVVYFVKSAVPDDGYQVVYFAGFDTTPLWKTLVIGDLYTSFVNDLVKNNKLSKGMFPGNRFVFTPPAQ